MRTALVTGAAGGIGQAICRGLAQDGVTVWAGYHTRRVQAEALAREIGGWATPCDVTSWESIQKAVDNVLEKFCQLDILICNAGVAWTGLTQEMGYADYRELMAVDLDGVFGCCRAALGPMIRAKSGKIVAISSMWGVSGGACEAAYSAAKAGVVGLTRALAREVGPSGVTVNCVAPGVIDTPMNRGLGLRDLAALADAAPLGRLGTPEDVAGAVRYLCSPAGDFVTGQVLTVDGGFTC